MIYRSRFLLVVIVTAICFIYETQSQTFRGSLPVYYSDAFARYLYWPLCEIPYDNDTEAEACLNQCFDDAQLVNTSTVSCGIGQYLDQDPCTGSVIVAHDYNVIILSFEGGDTTHQTGYIMQVSSLWEPVADPALPIGKMNFYYINGFKLLFVNQTLQRAFNAAVAGYPTYNVLVVGHSLGGAFATIASANIRLNYQEFTVSRLHAATFGALIVGDAEFAANFSQLVPHNQRVVHADDFAPRIATDMLINGTSDRAYLHVQGDTWYNNEMEVFAKYQVCPGLYHYGYCTYTYNSSQLLTSQTLKAHLNYFGAIERCSLCNRTLDLALLPA